MRLLPLLLLLTFLSCRDENKAKSFEQMTDRIEDRYVSDRRTDRFEVDYGGGFQGLYVRGYTTVPAAYDSLQRVLTEGGFVVARNEFRLLPDAELLNGKTAGIINVSVANLRSEPGHSQELATQALLGTPIRVLDYQDGWYLVRTPDRYLAWLEPGAFVLMTPKEAAAWLADDLRVYVDRPAEVTTTPGSTDYVTDLIGGGLVGYTDSLRDGKRKLRLPDQQTGWTDDEGFYPVAPWFRPVDFEMATITNTARLMKGRTYLWGGTSLNAMDCSGFTKTAYYLNGYVIPRDASQQVHAGTAVELTDDLDNLDAGDLLFFGGYRADRSEKITHVGMYLGEGRFIHAGADNGRIAVQSLLPDAPDYAAHRRESLLRARRLRPGDPGVVPVGRAFAELLGVETVIR